jgi:hypothetical protein
MKSGDASRVGRGGGTAYDARQLDTDSDYAAAT